MQSELESVLIKVVGVDVANLPAESTAITSAVNDLRVAMHEIARCANDIELRREWGLTKQELIQEIRRLVKRDANQTLVRESDRRSNSPSKPPESINSNRR